MSAIVIDTNVLLVADGQAKQVNAACVDECRKRLERVRAREQIVLDDTWLILREYQNKLSPNRSPTPGSAFLKWLLQVQAVAKHVSKVRITPIDREQTRFAEFPPDAKLEADFDPADRKFVAVANAHSERPPILESADSKWLGWEAQLKNHGIVIEVLCRKELQVIRNGKTK